MSVVTPEASVTDGPGWDQGTAKRFGALAGGRALAQVLGMVWFLLAARSLSESEFGVVATGLAFFAVFAGLGDLGTTRTVVRYVAEDKRTMWSAYRRALELRVGGGLAIGIAVAALVAVLPIPISAAAVLLAGGMAIASGATELAYAALRSVGHIRAELALLVGERASFLLLGAVVLYRDGGPLVILGLYLGTNVVSAGIAGVAVRRAQPSEQRVAGSMVDAEARFTAAGFALVTVAPRLPSLLVAVFASASAVGVFAVAQRPIEALTLFALSTCAPVLPIIRSRITRGLRESAEGVATSITGALLLVLAPLVAWFAIAPDIVLDLLLGDDRYPGAELVLRVMAATSLTWSLRGVGEFVLLAEERARRLFGLTLAGTILTLVLGTPLVIAFDELGAAATVAGAEALMTVLLLQAVPGLRDRAALRAFGPALGLLVVTSLALMPFRHSTFGVLVVVAAAGLVAVGLAARKVQRLEVLA